jgi:hypothetical protein
MAVLRNRLGFSPEGKAQQVLLALEAFTKKTQKAPTRTIVLAERRRARGKTQTQVAALMRTSPAIVSRLESGHDVRVSTLEKYVAALGFQLELKATSPRKATTKTSRTRRAKK